MCSGQIYLAFLIKELAFLLKALLLSSMKTFFFFLVSMKTFFVFGHAQQLYSDGGQESSKQQIWATVKCGEVGLRLRIL